MSSKEPAPVDQAKKAEYPITRYSKEDCEQLGYEYFTDEQFAFEQQRYDALMREKAKRERARQEERNAAYGKKVAGMVPDLHAPAQDAEEGEVQLLEESKPSKRARSPSHISDDVSAKRPPPSASARSATPPPPVDEDRLKTHPYDD